MARPPQRGGKANPQPLTYKFTPRRGNKRIPKSGNVNIPVGREEKLPEGEIINSKAFFSPQGKQSNSPQGNPSHPKHSPSPQGNTTQSKPQSNSNPMLRSAKIKRHRLRRAAVTAGHHLVHPMLSLWKANRACDEGRNSHGRDSKTAI